MSENWVSKASSRLRRPSRAIEWRYVIGLPVWVAMSFIAANFIAVIGLLLLRAAKLYTPVLEDPAFNTAFAAFIYVLTLAFTLGGPWLLRRRLTTKSDLGLSRLPDWMDILLAPAGAVLYLLLSGIFITLFTISFPQVNLEQAQDIGFQNLSGYSQYLLAFVTLVIIAPLAEEVLFRGYLYGKLRKHGPLWLAILLTSGLFALAHGQWNVSIDTFALSLVLCSLREVTGSIWAGVLLHMIKNGLAFYLLFINPSLLTTISG